MREFLSCLFFVVFGFILVLCDILAGVTNPDELSFDLRIYPSVAVFCCCGGAVAAARRPRRPRVAAAMEVVAHGDDMWRSRNMSCRMNVE